MGPDPDQDGSQMRAVLARASRRPRSKRTVVETKRVIKLELDRLIRTAAEAGLLPAEQNAGVASPALVGAMLEGLIGPLAPEVESSPARRRDAVQSLTLLLLRALGVADARARGLVVQTIIPPPTHGAA